jgi:hypothetical protein
MTALIAKAAADERAPAEAGKGLHDPDVMVRVRIVNALVNVAEPERSIELLLEAARDPHWAVRQAAITGLAKVGGDAAFTAIGEATHDPDVNVRRTAVASLRAFNAPQSNRFLVGALKDPEPAVALEAKNGLALRGLTPEWATGKVLEESGERAEAFRAYVSDLAAPRAPEWIDRSRDPVLEAKRRHIMELARALTPPPEVPETARQELADGKTALKAARVPADCFRAAEHFVRAREAAPWSPDIYLNLAAALEQAGEYVLAARDLDWYLIAAPSAPDAAKVQKRIAALKKKAER